MNYLCGCDADTVGQSFVDGRIVCPRHNAILEPGAPPPPLWRGRVVATIEVETADRRLVERFVDHLSDDLARPEFILAASVTIAETVV